MNDMDFLLYDYKFDSTNITYSFDYSQSTWDGYSPNGVLHYFDSAQKSSLDSNEQSMFTISAGLWSAYSAFSISSTTGKGNINIYEAPLLFDFAGQTEIFQNENDTRGTTQTDGVYKRSEIVFDSNSSPNSVLTTLHEIGHALGLDHGNHL